MSTNHCAASGTTRPVLETLEPRLLLSTIEGTITDHATSAPLANVDVQLYEGELPDQAGPEAWSYVASAWTDTSGYFNFSGLDPQNYRVRVYEGQQSDGRHYIGANAYDVFADPSTGGSADLSLREAGLIYGYVTDEFGNPLHGVEVICDAPYTFDDDFGWHTDTTDAAGRYEFWKLATDQTFYPVKIGRAVSFGSSYDVFGTDDVNAMNALTPDTHPVQLGFEHLGGGAGTLTVPANSYSYYVVWAEGDNHVSVDAVEFDTGMFWDGGSWWTGGSVTSVYDMQYAPDGYSTQFGQPGRNSFVGFAAPYDPVEITVYALDEGLPSQPTPWAPQVSTALYPADPLGTPGPDFQLEPGSWLEGQVIAEGYGPLANQWDVLEPWIGLDNGIYEDPNIGTDADGWWRVPIPADTPSYLYTAGWETQAWEYEGQHYSWGSRLLGPYEVAAGDSLTVDPLVVPPAATITGQVTDMAGNPLAGVEIGAFGSDTQGGEIDIEVDEGVVTDASGFYTFDFCPAGTVYIEGFFDGRLFHSPGMEVAPGGALAYDFVLDEDGFTVNGAVVNYGDLRAATLPIEIIDYEGYGDLPEDVGVFAYDTDTPWTLDDYLDPRRRFTADVDVRGAFDDYFAPAPWTPGSYSLRLPAGNQTLVSYVSYTAPFGGGWFVKFSDPIFVSGAGGDAVDNADALIPTGEGVLFGSVVLDESLQGEVPCDSIRIYLVPEDQAVGGDVYPDPLAGPVDGLGSELFNGPGRALLTPGPDGIFIATDLPEGSYRLYGYAPGAMPYISEPFDLAEIPFQNVFFMPGSVQIVAHEAGRPADDRFIGWGPQPVGTSTTPGTFEVTNLGGEVLQISDAQLLGANAGDYDVTIRRPDGTIESTLPINIQPLETWTIDVVFTASDVGLRSAYIQLDTNDPAEPGVRLDLGGVGGDPEIVVTDSVLPDADLSVDFGDVLLGGAATQTVTIDNAGDWQFTLITPSIAAGDAAAFSLELYDPTGAPAPAGGQYAVEPGEPWTLDVTFQPQAPVAHWAQLELASSDSDNPFVYVDLVANGAAPPPDLSVTDSTAPNDDRSLVFPPIDVGQTSAQRAFDLSNVAPAGATELWINSDQLAGPDLSDFTVNFVDESMYPVVAPFPIAPQTTSHVLVQFHPQTPGEKEAWITLGTNDPDDATVTLALAGTGVGETIDVLAPADGNRWFFGQPAARVAWDGGVPGDVAVELYYEGEYYDTIIEGTPNDGAETLANAVNPAWEPGDAYQVKVIDSDGNFGWSDPFSIALPQVINLMWGEPVPWAIERKVNAFGGLHYDHTEGAMPAADVPEHRRDEIRNSVQAIFHAAGIDGVFLTNTPAVQGSRLYFTQPPAKDWKLLGMPSEPIDRFNRDPDDEAAVFLTGDPLIDVEVIAHEIAHLLGVRHVNPGGADPRNAAVMDQELNPDAIPVFTEGVTPLFEPRCDGTHNPVYHLERYVDGTPDFELFADGILPGSWDAENGAGLPVSFDFADNPTLLYDVRVYAGYGLPHTMRVVGSYDTITAEGLGGSEFLLQPGETLRLVGGTQDDGLWDVVAATGDPMNVNNQLLTGGFPLNVTLYQRTADDVIELGDGTVAPVLLPDLASVRSYGRMSGGVQTFGALPGRATTTTLAAPVAAPASELDFAVVEAPAHGRLAEMGPGSYVYVPDVGYAGPDAFTYTYEPGGERVDVRLDVGAAVPLDGKGKLTYVDAAGDKVKVKVKGGEATAWFADHDRERLMRLLVKDAGDRTKIKITGGGETELGDVEILGSAKKVTVRKAKLTGRLSATGAVDKLKLDDARDAEVVVLGDGDAEMKVALGDVTDLRLVTAGTVGKIKAGAWKDTDGDADVLAAAGGIGKLKIDGDGPAVIPAAQTASILPDDPADKSNRAGDLDIDDLLAPLDV